ncbi:MAG: OmpA family protein [Candidatus Aminicenantes bacterium]|nr:OmpA family protein [Candidatus Aminicenantes bacterium]
MKKISFIFLLFVLIAVSVSISIYSDAETDFTGLLKGEKIISSPGTFALGKGDFDPKSTAFLDKLGVFLRKNQGLIIEIGGHTDNSGTTAINRRLSLARAQKAQEYLIGKAGIEKNRLLVKGYASASPIADNRTAAGRAKNRRIEITPLKNVDPAGRVTYIRRDVLTKKPDMVDFARASLNQGLYHLDRLLTRRQSNANITFQDLSKINLGPQSLMIMYSLLEKNLQLPRKKNVRLLTGGLRTKLNKLKKALRVETPSCVVNSNSVEILVGIDKKKKSALSVFDGSSEIEAQGKTVAVPGGYGTVVEMNKPPEPPQPLPAAPRLITPLNAEISLTGAGDKDTAVVRFQWQQAEGAYHLQVARDDGFEEIVADRILDNNSAVLDFTAGAYHWRAAVVNKRGIEGYAAHSIFTVSGQPPTLPLHITPGPKEVIRTEKPALTISGKTLPGAQVFIEEQALLMQQDGAFFTRVSLGRGWNDIRIRASHRDYKDKTIWITVYRRVFSESALILGYRFDYALKNEKADDTYAFQVGKTFRLTSRFESEFSIGLSRLQWQDFPGVYKRDALAIPLSAELHFMFGKGPVVPYLNAGVTGYLTFARYRYEDKTGTKFFISPEIGVGISFPVSKSAARLEVKYAPLLKSEPFYPRLADRLTFILKLLLYRSK